MAFVLALLQTVAPLAVQRTGTFASRRVMESSGVAVSATGSGLVWTINDSGDGPYLYATDSSGADRGALRIPEAEAIDWEDLALGPCPTVPGSCLFAGDVGDNAEARPWVTLYAVPEPPAPAGPADTTRTTATPAVLHLRYPDRPHDVEAMFVTPAGALYLVTKGRSGRFDVFRVGRRAWTTGAIATPEHVQTLPVAPVPFAGRWVTGAALAPNGRRVALRTYVEIFFFELAADGSLEPTGPVCMLGRTEPQGEAAAFLDDRRLLLTSEAAGADAGPIHIVQCPS